MSNDCLTVNIIDEASDCWVPCDSDGAPLRSNRDGYVQRVVVQPSGGARRSGQGGTRITAYVHQLGWWASRDFDPNVVLQYRTKVVARGQSMTVSHLCHFSACFNPDHLTLEPRWVNIYRDRCCKRRKGEECRCHYSRIGDPNKYEACL